MSSWIRIKGWYKMAMSATYWFSYILLLDGNEALYTNKKAGTFSPLSCVLPCLQDFLHFNYYLNVKLFCKLILPSLFKIKTSHTTIILKKTLWKFQNLLNKIYVGTWLLAVVLFFYLYIFTCFFSCGK